MKTGLLTMALLMGFASQGFAEFKVINGDQKFVTIMCERLQPAADDGLTVEVREGGFAPVTEVSVTRSLFAGSQETTYAVERVQSNRIGAPVTYTGEGITLSINFTVAPMDDGSSRGTLYLKNGENTLTEDLRCHPIYHTM